MAHNHGHGQDQYASGNCTVKFNGDCPHCKDKVFRILSSIRGNNYDIVIEAERGFVSFKGEVDPTIFAREINRDSGVHGELVRARIVGNEVSYGCTHSSNNNHHSIRSSGAYHALPSPYGGDRMVVYPSGYETHHSYGGVDPRVYPSGYDNHPVNCRSSCCRPSPPAIHIPSYPPQQGPYNGYNNYGYDQYGSGMCSIM